MLGNFQYFRSEKEENVRNLNYIVNFQHLFYFYSHASTLVDSFHSRGYSINDLTSPLPPPSLPSSSSSSNNNNNNNNNNNPINEHDFKNHSKKGNVLSRAVGSAVGGFTHVTSHVSNDE